MFSMIQEQERWRGWEMERQCFIILKYYLAWKICAVSAVLFYKTIFQLWMSNLVKIVTKYRSFEQIYFLIHVKYSPASTILGSLTKKENFPHMYRTRILVNCGTITFRFQFQLILCFMLHATISVKMFILSSLSSCAYLCPHSFYYCLFVYVFKMLSPILAYFSGHMLLLLLFSLV